MKDETIGRSLGNESLEENVPFRSTIDTSIDTSTDTGRSRTRRIQFIIFIFVKTIFKLCKKRCNETSRFKVGFS